MGTKVWVGGNLHGTSMNLIKLFTIDKEFVFKGQLHDLSEILDRSKDINCEILSRRELRFTPDFSWGTLGISGGVSFEIYVSAFLTEHDPGQLIIHFKTGIRPEHYFFIVIILIIFGVTIFSDESKWLILYVAGLMIICHSWFQYIYRLQERYLIDKIVKKLKLSVR